MGLWARLGRRRRLATHLTSGELLNAMTTEPPPLSGSAERHEGVELEAHLQECDVCRNRSESLGTFLSELADSSDATFAEAFPPERIATQRARILKRLRRSIEPASQARILRFPARTSPALSRARRARRWLGAAAAAGLVAGLGISQFMHLHPEPPSEMARIIQADARISPQNAADPRTSALDRPSRTGSGTSTESDDAFLDELELVLSGPRVPQLTSLDELTPRIRDIAVNVW